MKINKKKIIAKCSGVLFLTSILFVFNLSAQTAKKQSSSINLLTGQINKFLTSWLIKKDNKAALNFFSQKAFTNREMLNDSCAGYIKKEDYSNPNHVRAGISKFLQEFSSEQPHKTLNDWLSKENEVIDKSETKSIIKLPKTTKYHLFRLNPELVESTISDNRSFPYLNKYLAGKNTVLLVVGLNLKFDRAEVVGYLYFIWSKENENWKILHAGMFCV